MVLHKIKSVPVKFKPVHFTGIVRNDIICDAHNTCSICNKLHKQLSVKHCIYLPVVTLDYDDSYLACCETRLLRIHKTTIPAGWLTWQ